MQGAGRTKMHSSAASWNARNVQIRPARAGGVECQPGCRRKHQAKAFFHVPAERAPAAAHIALRAPRNMRQAEKPLCECSAVQPVWFRVQLVLFMYPSKAMNHVVWETLDGTSLLRPKLTEKECKAFFVAWPKYR